MTEVTNKSTKIAFCAEQGIGFSSYVKYKYPDAITFINELKEMNFLRRLQDYLTINVVSERYSHKSVLLLEECTLPIPYTFSNELTIVKYTSTFNLDSIEDCHFDHIIKWNKNELSCTKCSIVPCPIVVDVITVANCEEMKNRMHVPKN